MSNHIFVVSYFTTLLLFIPATCSASVHRRQLEFLSVIYLYVAKIGQQAVRASASYKDSMTNALPKANIRSEYLFTSSNIRRES